MKIGLRYTGDDEAMQKKLEASDGVQYFEPIDAREILSSPGQDYEIDEESRKMIGMQFDPRLKGEGSDAINIPQLQSEDAELQTGLSAEKYGRSQVVKAVPNAAQPTAMNPLTTSGRPLNIDEVGTQAAADARMGYQQAPEEGGGSQSGGAPASEGMTSEEMRTALKAKGVQFPADAKKAELAELVDRHNAR
jgi:hypothetical protein